MRGNLYRSLRFAFVMLVALAPVGNAAAATVFTEAFAQAGPVTVNGATASDLGPKPESSATAFHSQGGFHAAAGALARVDVETDGLDLGVDFFLDGDFDPTRREYRARATASYETPLVLIAGPGGLPGGTGSIRFRFDIHGSMAIDGTPVPGTNNFGGLPSVIEHFNQLRVRLGGDTAVPFQVNQSTPGTLGFGSFVVTGPLPLNLSDPGMLLVDWMGVAAIDFMGGAFKVESLFGQTATLTAVEVRDPLGALLDVQLRDDLGRALVAAPVPIPTPGLLLLSGLGGLVVRCRARSRSRFPVRGSART